jgi:uncharacterized protein (TIGR02301 family)
MPTGAQAQFPFFLFPRREQRPPEHYLPQREPQTQPRPALPRPAQPRATTRTTPEDPPRIEGAPPPYDPEMSRLAEILGALHYLHPLCGGGSGPRWRAEMEGLLDAEQPGPERRGRLIASFNRGFFTYEQTYRTCTEAAGLAINRFFDEGARLSRDIATRYAY